MAKKTGKQGEDLPGFRAHAPRPELDRPAKDRRPKPVQEVLGRILGGGLARRLGEARAVEIWNEVVGEAIARVTSAEDFAGGTLTVRVLHPVWRVELQPMEAMIVDRLNERLEGRPVRRLRFV